DSGQILTWQAPWPVVELEAGVVVHEVGELAAALRRAAEEALPDEGDAGVLEDWRTLLALVADGASRLRAAG
ncbi:hypothetical protein ACWEGQ_35295, partial [Streptomyces seoulensis]